VGGRHELLDAGLVRPRKTGAAVSLTNGTGDNGYTAHFRDGRYAYAGMNANRGEGATTDLSVVGTIEIYDRQESLVDLGVPNIALAEYKAPDNYAAADCPLCRSGEPVTAF
jgi:hypothetical protein